ncbi:MAG: PilZ domain-containing protein, partial [Alphaproteobacteria bacterium]
LMPVVALWCTFNVIVLLIVLVTAFSTPSKRAEERFALDEPILLRGDGGTLTGRIHDISLSGVAVRLDTESALAPGDWLAISIADAGEIPGRIVRRVGNELGMIFHLPLSPTRDRLIRKIFTGGYDNTTRADDQLAISMQMISSIFRHHQAPAPAAPDAAPETPPARLIAEIAARASDLSNWDGDILAELWQAHSGPGGGKAA